ncbi:hypothetical protein P70_0033 [Listeria phage P70]|uniref:Uncharacterized protein n=1 Tax=Listeria phage P70 TaxID=1225800 RepID=J9QP93_9CAUD|nr:hypothetical protein P70_0033 [Listeria phage P70]AFQ96222.1 hypothetical protein P70_0033 [Listeria phage P70]
MAKKKIDYKDWESIPVSEWNGSSFNAYIASKNIALFGKEHHVSSYPQQNSLIKRYGEQHTKEFVKQVIDNSFEAWQFKGRTTPINFMFIYCSLREEIERATIAQFMGEDVESTIDVDKDKIDYSDFF